MKRTLSHWFPWLVLAHVLLFLAFWLTNEFFFSYVNDYLAGLLGPTFDYVTLTLVLSGALGAWTLVRLYARGGNSRALTAWLYLAAGLVYLIFFYGSFYLLLRKSPVQVPRLFQLVQYMRILLDPVLLLGGTLVPARFLRRRLREHRPTDLPAYGRALVPVLILFGAAWTLLLLLPPGPIYRGALPDKPKLMAHRGASILSPENTRLAFERAAALGVYGVETDLRLSRDGGIFIMHDDNFKRTTNAAQVYPGGDERPVEEFTFAEAMGLNAGEWYVRTDPYAVIRSGQVSAADVAAYRAQTVPALADVLEVVRRNKLAFIFDLKESPSHEADAARFFRLAFDQIHAAGIDAQVWFLVDTDQLETLRSSAPEMKPAYGLDYEHPVDPRELVTRGYRIVNTEYGLSDEWIRRYHDAGLWVNVYTVDEPWQFSRLWLLGAESATTSNSHALARLSGPEFALPFAVYAPLWALAGLVGLGVLLGLTRAAWPIVPVPDMTNDP